LGVPGANLSLLLEEKKGGHVKNTLGVIILLKESAILMLNQFIIRQLLTTSVKHGSRLKIRRWRFMANHPSMIILKRQEKMQE
jgi:hypothetical protein